MNTDRETDWDDESDDDTSGPSGDRHFVLLLPGFTVGDWSNAPLAAVVRRAGARPKKWRLGTNEGPTDRVVNGIQARLAELYYRQERKVTVIGMSLGGIYARQLARWHPEMVRQVVTVGSPFRFGEGGRSSAVQKMWKSRLDRFDPAVVAEINQDEDDKTPLEMPATSIFSRFDDVVPWNRSLNANSSMSENIEVRGASHLGLLVHPGVHLALNDRLRQPEGEWKPFRPPLAARMMFRRAPDYDPDRAHASK